jgi:hypothetical protein
MATLRISRIPNEYIEGITKIAERKGVSVSYLKKTILTKIVNDEVKFRHEENKEMKIPNVPQNIVNKFETKCKTLGISRRTIFCLELKKFIEENSNI